MSRGPRSPRRHWRRSTGIVVAIVHHRPLPRTQLAFSGYRNPPSLRGSRTCRCGRSTLALTHRSKLVAAARRRRFHVIASLRRLRMADPKANLAVPGNTFRIESQATPHSHHMPEQMTRIAGLVQNARRHFVGNRTVVRRTRLCTSARAPLSEQGLFSSHLPSKENSWPRSADPTAAEH